MSGFGHFLSVLLTEGFINLTWRHLFPLVSCVSGMHPNKALYTFGYTCITAGAAGILFVGTYVVVSRVF